MSSLPKNALCVLLALLCVWAVSGAQNTKTVDHSDMPIADVHRHVQHWITPANLLAEMDELKIGWAGAVSAPYGPWDIQPYIQLLGKRYIATTGHCRIACLGRTRR